MLMVGSVCGVPVAEKLISELIIFFENSKVVTLLQFGILTVDKEPI